MKKELTWENAPESLRVSEAATLLRISVPAAYGAIAAKLIPSYNFGERQIRISKSALWKVFGPPAEECAPNRRLSTEKGRDN